MVSLHDVLYKIISKTVLSFSKPNTDVLEWYFPRLVSTDLYTRVRFVRNFVSFSYEIIR